jgi:hypothetical protein
MISARADQVVWTLFHLDDLDADFARFYRRDWWEHSGPRMFARAVRLFAYDGVLAAVARRLAPVPDPDEPPDVLDMVNDPAYAGMVEVG